MLTEWLSVSVCVRPYPSSHASRVPVRGAPVPVLAPITPAVAVHGAEPVSKPGLPSFWPGLAQAPPAPAIVMVNDVEPDPAVLVAVTVTVNVPAAVGEPDTVPVPTVQVGSADCAGTETASQAAFTVLKLVQDVGNRFLAAFSVAVR